MGFLMFELSSLGISIIQQGGRNGGMKRRRREGELSEGIPSLLKETIIGSTYIYITGFRAAW